MGTGSYTPPQILTNADLEKIVDTSDEWIVSRTGIKERRIADRETATSDMVVAASKAALEMAGMNGEEIDLVLVATVTPDFRVPSTACCVQEKMNLPNAAAIDIVAACAGFIAGLAMAKAHIECGIYKNVLVVGVEKLSSLTNYDDRNTCVLFGDGAGAAVVSATENGNGIVSSYIKSDGKMREWLWAPFGGTRNPIEEGFPFDNSDKIIMAGSEVFKVAVREMTDACLRVIEMGGITPADISLVVPHQANIRIIDAIAKRLKVGRDRVVLNIERYGNTSAASIPIALDEANREGRIMENDYIVMVAFGGGMIWGAALLKW